MANRSPARSEIENGNGDLTEFDGDFPKSPLRNRVLNDLGSVPNSPVRSRNVSRSPLRERGYSVDFDFGFDGVNIARERGRDVSKSPVRERVGKTPASVRTRDVTRSPISERNSSDFDRVSKSPARSMNGDIPRSPMRRVVATGFDENAGEEQEEVVSSRKMAPKASFNEWISDDKHSGPSDDRYSDRRRRTWRDEVGDTSDQISEDSESVYPDEYGMTSKGLVRNPIHGIDPSNERIYRDLRFRGDYVGRHAKSRAIDERVTGRRVGAGVIHGNAKVVVERGRISSSSSIGDGTSNSGPNSIYGYADSRRSVESLRSIEDLNMERAMLLQKYRELKGQLNNFDGKRYSSPGLYSGSDDYSEDEFLRFRQAYIHPFAVEKNVRSPPHFNHGPGPVHNMADVYDCHDPFLGKMTRGARFKQPHQFVKQSIPGYIPGRSLDFDQELLESYLDETHFHHPTCPCSLCHINDMQGHALQNPVAYRTSANLAANTRSSHSLNLEKYGPRAYNRRMIQTAPQGRPSHIAHRHPRRAQVDNMNKRVCHPIAGGAPFVLCHSCFQLLVFPRTLTAIQKNEQQLKCGACSSVMSFDIENKSFGLLPPEKKPDSINSSGGFDEVLKESSTKLRSNSSNATSTNIGSYDFDVVGCSFQSMDTEASDVSKGRRLISSLPKNTHLSPSLSHSSEEEQITEIPLKMNLVPPPPGSPLRDLLEYSSHFHRSEAGVITSDLVNKKQVLEKDSSSYNSSVENTVVVGEDVHSNELATTGQTQDSGDVPRQEDKCVNNKGRQSWGIFSRPAHGSPGIAEVYVNSQPIPHRGVKKAEKFAGQIQPGKYWYDSKAGFWGVMGHHCLGIIPPCIPEFHFPMPVNCSGGDTSVYINGRELHERDLNLLASRGLPSTKNKRYVIDISGKVLDEETREFVVNLGNLAPTVERKGRGFGMQVPEHLHD